MSEQTVHLRGIGPHKAKPASELVVGEKIVYNYGYEHEICAIVEEEEDPESLLISVFAADGVSPFGRRFKKERLVPWVE